MIVILCNSKLLFLIASDAKLCSHLVLLSLCYVYVFVNFQIQVSLAIRGDLVPKFYECE